MPWLTLVLSLNVVISRLRLLKNMLNLVQPSICRRNPSSNLHLWYKHIRIGYSGQLWITDKRNLDIMLPNMFSFVSSYFFFANLQHLVRFPFDIREEIRTHARVTSQSVWGEMVQLCTVQWVSASIVAQHFVHNSVSRIVFRPKSILLARSVRVSNSQSQSQFHCGVLENRGL